MTVTININQRDIQNFKPSEAEQKNSMLLTVIINLNFIGIYLNPSTKKKNVLLKPKIKEYLQITLKRAHTAKYVVFFFQKVHQDDHRILQSDGHYDFFGRHDKITFSQQSQHHFLISYGNCKGTMKFGFTVKFNCFDTILLS